MELLSVPATDIALGGGRSEYGPVKDLAGDHGTILAGILGDLHSGVCTALRTISMPKR
jgi:hypothetical protein